MERIELYIFVNKICQYTHKNGTLNSVLPHLAKVADPANFRPPFAFFKKFSR